MSGCSCEKPKGEPKRQCPCDAFEHPPALIIPAGLTHIPRQNTGFPEFRRAMLAAIRKHKALGQWRARGDDDLGMMLLEMWAYVAGVQSFYDEVIAHEAYLRTARRRSSVRKLTGLLGYVPRPAVAAAISLAVLAEGRKPILLPKGLAFRSSAFDDEAPQVFELDAHTTVHPLANMWTLQKPRPPDIGVREDPKCLLLERGGGRPQVGDPVLVYVDTDEPQGQVRIVSSVEPHTAEDDSPYIRVEFNTAPSLPADNTPVSKIRLLKPTQSAGLWTLGSTPKAIEGNGETYLALDSIYPQIKPSNLILIARGAKYRWFSVTGVEQEMRVVTGYSKGGASDLTQEMLAATEHHTSDPSDESNTMPDISLPVTRLRLDVNLNSTRRKEDGDDDWTNADRAEIVVHYGLMDAGIVTVPAKPTLEPDDSLYIEAPFEAPVDDFVPTRFLLEDKNEQGLEIGGRLDLGTGELTLDQGTSWSLPLVAPNALYGNVVTASRGETVANEILGSGDASLANQSFTLKKSPLTYLPSPTAGNEQGVASTLKVYVEGILWREVPSFFDRKPEERVYVLHQNDDGETVVAFGDGRRGSRLPTGTDNVVATYRHGADRAAPPAGGITQLAKPVKGLTAIKSPMAARGGDDAETSDRLRDHAPQSALLLGRAVSMADMQAVAAGVPGVRSATVGWQWNDTKQRPVVQVWYVGDNSVKDQVVQRLRSLSDPTTPIAVDVAEPIRHTLSISVEIDEQYLEGDVLPRIRAALMDPETGLLAPERIGIGRPLFRSQVLEVVHSVEGVICVHGILLGFQLAQWPWTEHAIVPPAGSYFDFEQGGLLLHGKESDSG